MAVVVDKTRKAGVTIVVTMTAEVAVVVLSV